MSHRRGPGAAAARRGMPSRAAPPATEQPAGDTWREPPNGGRFPGNRCRDGLRYSLESPAMTTSTAKSYQPINLAQKVRLIGEQWSPRVVAELNDYQFKVARIEGAF